MNTTYATITTMNSDSGATIQDVKRGICETGTRGGESVSYEVRELACRQVGIEPPQDYSLMIISSLAVLLIVGIVVVYYVISKRKTKNP